MGLPKIFQQLSRHQEALARGEWELAYQQLRQKRKGGKAGSLSRVEALTLASLHRYRGEIQEAIGLLNEISDWPDPGAGAEAILQLGFLHLSLRTAPLAQVEETLRRGLASCGEDKRLRGIAAHLNSRLLWVKSELGLAGEQMEEARRLLEEAGDEEELAKVLDSLAMYHDHAGEREKALACYSLSLSKKALWRDLYGIGITLGNLGRLHLRMKDARTALSFLMDDLRIVDHIGDVWAQVVVKINVGQALTELRRFDEADKELREALFLARSRGWKEQEIYALKDLARAALLGGDTGRAFGLLDAALKLLPEDQHSYSRAHVLLVRGDLQVEAGELEKARETYLEARRCFAKLGARHEEASALRGLARVSEQLQEWNASLHYSEEEKKCLTFGSSAATARFDDTFRLTAVERFVPQVMGHYRILKRIGAGAYGEVYQGFDCREDASRDNVAIKVLRLEGVQSDREREDRISRFRRECEILRQVSHPNVVKIVDTGDEPLPYLVQEFVGGGDLNSILADGQVPTRERALDVMLGTLEGLIALHEKGIFHRDLKPGNILLRETGEPVIADFGIARMVDLTALTLQSMVMGTLGYMPPEQVRGAEVDQRADIYAAGVILHQLLTGRLPYEDTSLQSILRSLETRSPPDLSLLQPDLPPVLVECVKCCLEGDAALRYPRAQDLKADIEAARSALGAR